MTWWEAGGGPDHVTEGQVRKGRLCEMSTTTGSSDFQTLFNLNITERILNLNFWNKQGRPSNTANMDTNTFVWNVQTKHMFTLNSMELMRCNIKYIGFIPFPCEPNVIKDAEIITVHFVHVLQNFLGCTYLMRKHYISRRNTSVFAESDFLELINAEALELQLTLQRKTEKLWVKEFNLLLKNWNCTFC